MDKPLRVWICGEFSIFGKDGKLLDTIRRTRQCASSFLCRFPGSGKWQSWLLLTGRDMGRSLEQAEYNFLNIHQPANWFGRGSRIGKIFISAGSDCFGWVGSKYVACGRWEWKTCTGKSKLTNIPTKLHFIIKAPLIICCLLH